MPGKKLVYASLEELQKGLARLLAGCRKVAMQYSPRNAIPYISMVDAGTVEMVRAHGCRVVSSADLVQKFEASWSAEQYRFAPRCRPRDRPRDAGSLRVRRRVREEQISAHRIRSAAMDARAIPRRRRSPPTSRPSSPSARTRAIRTTSRAPAGSAPIRKGDLLLLDVWGKLDRPGSVYYDITWVGYLGAAVPEKYAKIFAIVRRGP